MYNVQINLEDLDIEISEDKMEYKKCEDADIYEDDLRINMPEVLDILLIDRTKSKKNKKQNIIWANDNYIKNGKKDFSPYAEIRPELITGIFGDIIKPRSKKNKEIQKERTKTKAEVFTPMWIVKLQNDEIDKNYSEYSLDEYVDIKWLEITCGEAPYIASRYDAETGEVIKIEQRVGFLDRKLSKINKQINDKNIWISMVKRAYKSSYGFEWNGDSLLLARENLLYTFEDYYIFKWKVKPSLNLYEEIAEIISYNLFQMDGLNYTIPFSEEVKIVENPQVSFFQDEEQKKIETVVNGTKVKIMNWEKGKMEVFKSGI